MPALRFANHHLRFARGDALGEEAVRAPAAHGFQLYGLSAALTDEGRHFEYRMTIRTRDERNFARLARALEALSSVHEFRICPPASDGDAGLHERPGSRSGRPPLAPRAVVPPEWGAHRPPPPPRACRGAPLRPRGARCSLGGRAALRGPRGPRRRRRSRAAARRPTRRARRGGSGPTRAARSSRPTGSFIRLMSAEAAQASSRVERAFAPWREARPEIRARVVGPDGAVTALEPGALAEAPLADAGGRPSSPRREVSGTIPGVRSGAVVEQVTVVRETAPPLAGAEVHRFRIGSPARLVRLRIEAPAATRLRWARARRRAHAGRDGGGWRAHALVRAARRGASPAEEPGRRGPSTEPYVAFAVEQGWADVAGRVRAAFDAAIAGADLREEARAALGAGRPPRRSRAPRRRLGARPRARDRGADRRGAARAGRPSDVLARGEADAKDLAALHVALLRATGLEADVALAATEWHDPPREAAGLGLLDRVLVRVGGKGPPIWLDPSARALAPGTLPLEAQGKLALGPRAARATWSGRLLPGRRTTQPSPCASCTSPISAWAGSSRRAS